jgi:hypothetical protein
MSLYKRGNWVVGHEVFRPGRIICPSAEEAVRNSFEGGEQEETHYGLPINRIFLIMFNEEKR